MMMLQQTQQHQQQLAQGESSQGEQESSPPNDRGLHMGNEGEQYYSQSNQTANELATSA